jgi:hypothetical protein
MQEWHGSGEPSSERTASGPRMSEEARELGRSGRIYGHTMKEKVK